MNPAYAMEGEILDCACPEIIHTPPQKGLEFQGRWGVL